MTSKADRFKSGLGAQAISPLENLKAKKKEEEGTLKPDLQQDAPTLSVEEKDTSFEITLLPSFEFTKTVYGQTVNLTQLMDTLNNYYSKGNKLKGRIGPITPLPEDIYLLAKETGNSAVIELIRIHSETDPKEMAFEITAIRMDNEGIIGTVTPSGPFVGLLEELVEKDFTIRGFPRYIMNSNLELRISTFDIGLEVTLPF